MPVLTPVAIPESEPIVATAVLLLAHVPPVTASVYNDVNPTHATDGPMIAPGTGLTVIISETEQPVPNV